MTHRTPATPTPEWCLANPLGGSRAFDAAALRRRSIGDVMQALVSQLDLYNCQFRDLATTDLAALHASDPLRVVAANIELILREYLSDRDGLDAEKLSQDLGAPGRRKLLLQLSNASRIEDPLALPRAEAERLVFHWIDTVNLLHDACDMSDTEALSLYQETRLEQLFQRVQATVSALWGSPAAGSCGAAGMDWTEDQHRRYLRLCANEMLHRLAGRVLGWQAIVDHDRHQVLQGIFPYYAGHRRPLFLAVLSRLADRYAMYRRVVLSMVFVLGYIGPFDALAAFRQMGEEGVVPGSCEEDRDELLQALAHYVLAWFYNEYESHLFLEREDLGAVEMPRWLTAPEGEESREHSLRKALVSMYSYYTPLDRGPLPAGGALFCDGRRTLREVFCRPEKFRTDHPELPPETPRVRVPEGALTDSPKAVVHAVGQMAHALSHAQGLEPLLADDFRELVRYAPVAAGYLVDAARSSREPLSLLRQLRRVVDEEEMPDDHKTRLAARLDFEIAERERPAEAVLAGPFGASLPLYPADEGDRERTAAGALRDLLAEAPRRFEEAARVLADGTAFASVDLRQIVCDPALSRIVRIGLCPDAFLDFSSFRDGSPGDAAFWRDYGFALWLGDLEVAQPPAAPARDLLAALAPGGAMSAGEAAARVGVAPEEAARSLEALAARGVIERAEGDGGLAYRLAERYRTEGPPNLAIGQATREDAR